MNDGEYLHDAILSDEPFSGELDLEVEMEAGDGPAKLLDAIGPQHVDMVITVQRTWKDRLFSLPWRPWYPWVSYSLEGNVTDIDGDEVSFVGAPGAAIVWRFHWRKP